MKKSLPYFAILICAVLITFVLKQCGSTKKKKPKISAQPTVKLTAVNAVFNILTNDYATVSAEKTIKDTLVLSDSTDEDSPLVKIKDSSYRLWMLYPVLDSAKNHIKKKIPNQDKTFSDSVTGRWIPAQKQMILEDYNRNFLQQ